MVIFVVVKDTRDKYLKLVGILNIGCLGVVIAVVLLAVHGTAVRVNILGFLCAGLTLGMYASPLTAMRTVIKSKSVEYMPFFLSFFLFLNAVIWCAYAVLVKDFFIGVPNVIGLVLGSAQLIVYAMYYNKSSSPGRTKSMEMEKMEEDGSAHLVPKDLEMAAYNDQDTKERNLNKGRSLPKTSVSRQLSSRNIIKAHSVSPYDLQSVWPLEDKLKLKPRER